MSTKVWTLAAVIAFTATLAHAAPEPIPALGVSGGSDDGLAQEDDDLDDILGLGDRERSTAEERRSLERGDSDVIGQRDDDEELLEEREDRPPIKVLQKKNFLKIGKVEAGGHLGFVSNDPFINRYIVGGNVGYHFTEVLSAELSGSFSPDFGEGDWKPITRQIIENNKVSPDISKIIWAVNATAQFAPIYGKIAILGGQIIIFDIYGLFGMGITGTRDDLEAIQCAGIEGTPCVLTANQVHPTTTLGGGFRVAFSDRFATRIEGRSLSFIETLNGTSLEMKNNFIIQASATFFFSTGGK
ncbi:MAG: outer membrane beta-barrel domain-containing protein [Deltaproteobacteria bacterium]|nr:MAG: outer membrane beta-barrel domain-containing protein [Deltaproteobacteria bacterium]